MIDIVVVLVVLTFPFLTGVYMILCVVADENKANWFLDFPGVMGRRIRRKRCEAGLTELKRIISFHLSAMDGGEATGFKKWYSIWKSPEEPAHRDESILQYLESNDDELQKELKNSLRLYHDSRRDIGKTNTPSSELVAKWRVTASDEFRLMLSRVDVALSSGRTTEALIAVYLCVRWIQRRERYLIDLTNYAGPELLDFRDDLEILAEKSDELIGKNNLVWPFAYELPVLVSVLMITSYPENKNAVVLSFSVGFLKKWAVVHKLPVAWLPKTPAGTTEVGA